MPDERMRKRGPLLFGEKLHEVKLNFIRIVFGGKAHSVREPFDMGVDDDAGNSKRGSKNDVGGFSADAGELCEFLHRFWNLPFVFCDQFVTAGNNAFGLIPVKSGRPDVLLKCPWGCRGVVSGGFVFLKEVFCDLVHSFVRALSRENGGHEELQRISMMEGTLGVGDLFSEDRKDLPRPLLGSHFFLSFSFMPQLPPHFFQAKSPTATATMSKIPKIFITSPPFLAYYTTTVVFVIK